MEMSDARIQVLQAAITMFKVRAVTLRSHLGSISNKSYGFRRAIFFFISL